MTRIPFTGKFKVTCVYLAQGNLWRNGYHQGIDLVGITNKNVYSICNGIVERAGWDAGGFGNYVRIKEDGTENRMYFAHLKQVNVKVGQKVTYSTIVGIMGNTGNSTGLHTHFEIREFKDGQILRRISPAIYMGIPNKKGTYNSKDYEITLPKEIKIFAVKTNIREMPSLKGTPHLYLPNTKVEILLENVAYADGYWWDKVYCPATGRVGYVARTSNRYK